MPVKINSKINRKQASISPYKKKKKKKRKMGVMEKKNFTTKFQFSNQGNAPFLYTKKS